MRRNLKRVGLIAFALTVCGAATAQTSQLQLGNVELYSYEWDGSSSRTQSLAYVTARNGGVAELDTVRFVNGLNSTGASSQMTVKVEGTGQVDSSALKASASITVTDPVVARGAVTNMVSVKSSAWLMEDLIIGNASVTSIQFSLRIDGTQAASSPSRFNGDIWPQSSVLVAQGEGLNFTNSRRLYSRSGSNSAGASFDDYVFTDAIKVVNGAAALNVQLVAEASVLFREAGKGVFSAQSLFDHTASIVEVYAYDSTGAQVALPDVRTSAGFLYQAAPVAAVPEPEQFAMLLAGLGMLAGVVCRRKAMARCREVRK